MFMVLLRIVEEREGKAAYLSFIRKKCYLRWGLNLGPLVHHYDA